MSATEAAITTVALASVEDAKPAETTPAPATEIPNTQEVVAVATGPKQEARTEEAPAPAEAPAAEGEAAPAATEEPAKGEADPVKGETQKEERPKNSNPLMKFFTSIKSKAKGGPKSPKKEKKEEAEAPAAEEAPKEEPAAAEPAAEAPEAGEAPATVPVKETETAVPAPTTEAAGGKKAEKTEEKKEDGKKKRLSSLIPSLPSFGKPKSRSEAPASAKVDENPPKIEEPAPVAPLTHPDPDPTSAVDSKPEEATTETTPANPTVAAAA